MKIISGSFDNRLNADQAVTQLIAKGFRQEDISLIMSDRTRDAMFSDTTEKYEHESTGDKVGKGGFAGALTAGAIGALIGGLTAVGSVVIPGAGLLVAGPIIGALTGAGVGAASGGLLGALLAAGFADDEAKLYEKEVVEHNKVLVVVHAEDSKAAIARSILKDNGAVTKAA